MSEKYQRPDHIRVVKAVCVEFGNNDDTWTWCYLDVREALTKAKELLMKLEPDERLVVGTAYCGQNLRTGEILELVPAEDYLEIGGVKCGTTKKNSSGSNRLSSADGRKGLLSISSVMCDGKRRGGYAPPLSN